MRTKAQATSLSHMLVGLLTVALVGMLVFFFISRGQGVKVTVEENEILRRRVILSNVLLSSEKMAYTDSTIHRGVLDKGKLDSLAANPTPLFSEISYPDNIYRIKVTDLDNNKEWVIGGDFKPSFKTPVSIRYSDDDIHLGFMFIDFTKSQ